MDSESMSALALYFEQTTEAVMKMVELSTTPSERLRYIRIKNRERVRAICIRAIIAKGHVSETDQILLDKLWSVCKCRHFVPV